MSVFFYLNDRFLKIESQRSIGYPLLQALDILYYGIKTRHIFWFWRDSLRISYCLIKGSDWFLEIVKSTHCRRVKKNYLRLLRLLFETFKITTFSENPFEIAFDNRLKGGTEAVAQTCFVKKVFLENSKSSLENTCARVSILIKLQVWDLQLY